MRPIDSRLIGTLFASAALFAEYAIAAEDPHYNQVTIHAQASQVLAHDRMTVTLYSEAQDKDPARLASHITNSINQAVGKARQVPKVTVSLGPRSSYPVYDNPPKAPDRPARLSAWRERAEVRLESSDFATLAGLTGELLQSLSMGGMDFSVSESSRERSEDALTQQAVEAFKNRAQLITKALGGQTYRLVNLDLSGSALQPPAPVLYKAARMDSAAAAEIEGGTSTLRISADGTIEVQLPGASAP